MQARKHKWLRLTYLTKVRRAVGRHLPRQVRLWWQRRTRGWDDSTTWSLDSSLSTLILPRLRRFKAVTIAYPSDMTEQAWDEALDKMIAAFEFGASQERWSADSAEYTRHQEGLDLFAKYFWALWW
jgi:hypothetical protein